MQVLLDGFSFRVHVQSALSQFPWDTGHVRWFPCEDVPILTEKLDELAFLFVSHSCCHINHLGQIFRMDLHLLGFAGRLERRIWRHLKTADPSELLSVKKPVAQFLIVLRKSQ